MAMITIDIDDREVLSVLQELARRGANLRPAMLAIGEDLAESTRRRFETSTAPDGTPWADNSEVTYLMYLQGKNTRRWNKKEGKFEDHAGKVYAIT